MHWGERIPERRVQHRRRGSPASTRSPRRPSAPTRSSPSSSTRRSRSSRPSCPGRCSPLAWLPQDDGAAPRAQAAARADARLSPSRAACRSAPAARWTAAAPSAPACCSAPRRTRRRPTRCSRRSKPARRSPAPTRCATPTRAAASAAPCGWRATASDAQLEGFLLGRRHPRRGLDQGRCCRTQLPAAGLRPPAAAARRDGAGRRGRARQGQVCSCFDVTRDRDRRRSCAACARRRRRSAWPRCRATLQVRHQLRLLPARTQAHGARGCAGCGGLSSAVAPAPA